MKNAFRLNLLLIASAAFVACDGGGISVDIRGPSFKVGDEISEPVVSIGVANLGSGLRVNGVRYETHSATVLTNGAVSTLDDLQTGHFVQVEGRVTGLGLTGDASLVNMDANVIGDVESIDFDDSSLTILGQTVYVGSTTRFGMDLDPDDLSSVRLGARVAVSGYATANGALEATRIDLVSANAAAQVIGEAQEVDMGQRAFRIGNLSVDYSNSRVIELPGGFPRPGEMVLVRGELETNVLEADELLPAYASGSRTVRERVYLEGLVTQFTNTRAFDVGAHRVSTTGSTSFRNGAPGDLGSDSQLRVYGRIGSDGVTIVADTITYLTLVER
ncbi:MAG: DUF5666 domain-containing protein [Woeseiaceae bacterium]|nr:DUF5666 domain-containing protein [Woeseiaceae bacterium]